jgi:type 1 glutamine amidotransferase
VFRLALAFGLLAVPLAVAAPPVEELPKDPKAAKVVLVAGSNYYKPGEHDYPAACHVLFDLLKQTDGVAPVYAVDWPKKAETLAGAMAVVLFLDGGDKHPLIKGERFEQLRKLADGGCGVVQLHQIADYPKDLGDRARGLAGGAWEKGHSERAHWVVEFKQFPDHPVFRGVTPFKIDDGWLTKLRFADKHVTPLLRTSNPKATAKPTGTADVVAWAFEPTKAGRAFTFTGGHLHASFAEEGYRRFVVNGILWAAGVEVPKGGAKVELDAKTLPAYLTPPPTKR